MSYLLYRHEVSVTVFSSNSCQTILFKIKSCLLKPLMKLVEIFHKKSIILLVLRHLFLLIPLIVWWPLRFFLGPFEGSQYLGWDPLPQDIGRNKLVYNHVNISWFHCFSAPSNTPLNHVVQEATVVDLPFRRPVLTGFLKGPHHVTCCWSYKGVEVTTPGDPSLQPALKSHRDGWSHGWEMKCK